MKPSENRRQVRVARIGRPHGIRGEVTVEVFTDDPDSRFDRGRSLNVRLPGGRAAPYEVVTVEKARWNKTILLLKFIEFADRNTAEAFRNAELYDSATATSNEGEGWYAADLTGLPVHQGSFATPIIGMVAGLKTRETQDLLEIRLTDGREVLVPFVKEIVPVIAEDQGIIITPPQGLLELNQ